jgi:DNA-binding transcriptional ArsR family regulator
MPKFLVSGLFAVPFGSTENPAMNRCVQSCLWPFSCDNKPSVRDELKSNSCSKFMKALGTGERLKIVQSLLHGPRNVTEIADLLGEPVANASHHLKILEAAGLVQTERDGKFIYYSLNPKVHKKMGEDTLEFGCCRIELGKPN